MSSRLVTIAGFAALLVGLHSSPASAMCDVIPQPETVFRGETGSLNRVFASPGDRVRISIDLAGCEVGAGGFEDSSPGLTTSDFETGTLEGWTSLGAHASFAVSPNGNPGSALNGQDDGGSPFGAPLRAVAPAAFLGNWTARGVSQLRWDHWTDVDPEDEDADYLEGFQRLVRVTGPGGVARWRVTQGFIESNTTPSAWGGFVADIDTSMPTGSWVLASGTWSALMADVTEVAIQGELGKASDDSYRLDNVELVDAGSSGSVTTLLFEPPGGPANAVVVPVGGTCAALASELTACELALGGGTAACRDDLSPDVTADSLLFSMPDEGLAGPVTIAVSPEGATLPCGLATTQCADPGAPTGLLACIDSIYASDGTCAAEEANLHAQFPGLTALPVRNDFESICDSANPSIPCSNSLADVLLTTDAAGNLVIPIDWRGVLVPGTLPIPRLVRATSNAPAFVGPPPEPAQTLDDPIEVPGRAFLQSFSAKGLRVDPLFNPLFSEGAAETELFGSVDAEFGVVRILRRSPGFRQCEAGDRAALPCIADFECPGSSCGAASCRGGAEDGSLCASDAQCPGGECGAGLYDFSDRYSSGGTGPIVMTSADYDAEALNPAAIDGIEVTQETFTFVRSEPIEAADLNADGDQLDDTVVVLQDAQDAAPLVGGIAAARASNGLFRFPPVAVEGEFAVLLESESSQGVTRNAAFEVNSDQFDHILRIYEIQSGVATEISAPNFGEGLAVSPLPRVEDRSVVVSDGLVFFRESEVDGAGWRLDGTATPFGTIQGPIFFSGDMRYHLGPIGTEQTATLVAVDRDPDEDGLFVTPFSTVQVNVDSAGVAGNGTNVATALSRDGRYAAFHSNATNLVTGSNDGNWHVYLHDRDADGDGIFDEPGAIDTRRIDVDSAGVFSAGHPSLNSLWGGQVSTNGRWVSFTSAANDLVAGDLDGDLDTFIHDRDVDTDGILDEPGEISTFRISDLGIGGSLLGEMTPDGRFIAGGSSDSTLVAGDDNDAFDLFVVDRDSDQNGVFDEPGTVTVRSPTLATGNIGAFFQFNGISDDGRVAFGFEVGDGFVFYDRDGDEDGDLGEPGTVLRQVPPMLDAGLDIINAGAASLSPEGRFALIAPFPFGNPGFIPQRVDRETLTFSNLSGGNPTFQDHRIASIGARGEALYYREIGLPAFNRIRSARQNNAAVDRNADGDAGDDVLAVVDARAGGPPMAISYLAPADEVAVTEGNAIFLTDEADLAGGTDLNGDLDTDDRVVQLYRNRSLPIVNLGRAADDIAISTQVVAALVSEAGEGAVLNGDGDQLDNVVHVDDLATASSGTWTNLGLAADDVQSVGTFVAFTVPEADQGADLNGDGDQLDRVLHIYDTQAAQLLALLDEQGGAIPGGGLAVDDFALGEEIAAFRVSEAAQGLNLNDVVPPIPGGVADADLLDSVMHVADLATGTVYNSAQAAIPCPVEACDPRVPYRVLGTKVTHLSLEGEQGGNDLDQNGVINLVLQHFNAAALMAGGSMADAGDLLAGALAGVCTGTAESCASDLDCTGGGTCYFPPGGCLRDLATACDPLAGTGCVGSEFCVPLLGDPGNGTCHAFQGPCLTDADCSAPAFCTDDGANAERLFGAVGGEPDGRQRLVSEGRCSDGDGSCGIDADCNEGASCDVDQTVIATAADPDQDGLADPIDNCQDVANGDQLDTDGDGIGDACDRATCGNGVQEYGEECDAATDCDASCVYTGVGDACSDGVDNDGDGLIDSPSDPGCTDPLDSSEREAGLPCDDGIDNDGDFASDDPADIGCGSASGATESPECDDGIDNDGDGFIDFPTDPECTSGDLVTELPEPALLLQLAVGMGALWLFARRRAKASAACR